jgi:2-oxoglutarate ferredoxin oxidoreductase subunit beta
MAEKKENQKLDPNHFKSDATVRWCPGCGDHAILKTVERLLPELGIPRENHVFVSGIGCSSRFPYYVASYGFHGIHGRAPAVASGLKLANPELTVWVVTGDGDGLSIGGNHFMHLFRRNMNINVLLFNNGIYGLTKGQASPTSKMGQVTKSTPYGSIEEPVDPVSLALGAKATFAARTLAVDPKGMAEVLRRAVEHKGTSLVEIMQNCNVFNDGAFDAFALRANRPDNLLDVKHGKPLIFGKNKDKGIALDGFRPVVITKEDKDFDERVLVYDETSKAIASLIVTRTFPDYPVPVGVFYKSDRITYEDAVYDQIDRTVEKKGKGSLDQLLYSGDTWSVGDHPYCSLALRNLDWHKGPKPKA